MRTFLVTFALLLASCIAIQAGHAQALSLCEPAIIAAERAELLPANLLSAIAHVESGRPDPVTATIHPWPWTINADGIGRMFGTKAEAIEAVRALQAQGVHSIDVGCLQVSLLHHKNAFASLDEAFDPGANAAYAARFLRHLGAETQDWPAAAAAYHSNTPEIGLPYRQLVLAAWGMLVPPPGPWATSSRHSPTIPTGPRPPLRPFDPPALSGGGAAEALPLSATTIRLLGLAPDCPQALESTGSAWFGARRPTFCGSSPFAKTSALLHALAREPR